MDHQIIVQRLVEICLEDGILPHRTSHPDIANADFSHYGADSMSLVFLQALIEEEWGVRVPISHFAARLRNLNSVAIYIAEQVMTASRTCAAAPSSA